LRDRRRWLRRTAEAFHLLRPQQAFGSVRRAGRIPGVFARMLRTYPRAPDAIAKDPLSVAASHPIIIGRVGWLAQSHQQLRHGTTAHPNRCGRCPAHPQSSGTVAPAARLRAWMPSPGELDQPLDHRNLLVEVPLRRSIRHPQAISRACCAARSSIRIALWMSPLAFDGRPLQLHDVPHRGSVDPLAALGQERFPAS